jgi:intracellular sulfur oxidation DsrE/DsrF family protein
MRIACTPVIHDARPAGACDQAACRPGYGRRRAGFDRALAPVLVLLRWLATALVLVAAGSAAVAQPAQPARAPEIRVVYHADFADPRRFSAMLTSINHMMVTYQNDLVDADVRIVFNAHGIRFLTDDPLTGTPFAREAGQAERFAELRGRLLSLVSVHQVKLELCDITRSEIRLAQDRLYPVVRLVRSGVVRIAELQREGFAYLKVE